MTQHNWHLSCLPIQKAAQTVIEMTLYFGYEWTPREDGTFGTVNRTNLRTTIRSRGGVGKSSDASEEAKYSGTHLKATKFHESVSSPYLSSMEDTTSSRVSKLQLSSGISGDSPSRASRTSPSQQKNLSPEKRRATDGLLYARHDPEPKSPRRLNEDRHKLNIEATGTDGIGFSAKKRATVQFSNDVDYSRPTQRHVYKTSSSGNISYTGNIDIDSSLTYSGKQRWTWDDTSSTARNYSYATDETKRASVSDRQTRQWDNQVRKISSSPHLGDTRDADLDWLLPRASAVARDTPSPLSSDFWTDSSLRDSLSTSPKRGTGTSGRFETDSGFGQTIETPRRQKISTASRGASPEAQIARRGFLTDREFADLQERAMNTPPRETNKVVALKTENENLRDQLKKSQTELERVQRQLSEEEKKRRDIEREMKRQIAALEERVMNAARETQRAAALRQENEDLRDQLEKSQTILERVRRQLSEKEKYIQAIEKETSDKSADLRDLKRQIEKLNQASEAVKGKDEQIDQLTQQLQKRESDLKRFLRAFKALQRENDRLKDSAVPQDAVELYELELAHVFKHTDALSKKYYELLTHIENGVAQGLISDQFSFDEFLFFQIPPV